MSDPVTLTHTTAAATGGGSSGLGRSEAASSVSGAVEARPQVQERQVPAEQLASAASDLQKYAEKSGADLAFRVDEDSGRTVVSIVDRKDGTVLRQIPSEEALRIAKAVARFFDGNGSLVETVA